MGNTRAKKNMKARVWQTSMTERNEEDRSDRKDDAVKRIATVTISDLTELRRISLMRKTLPDLPYSEDFLKVSSFN